MRMLRSQRLETTTGAARDAKVVSPDSAGQRVGSLRDRSAARDSAARRVGALAGPGMRSAVDVAPPRSRSPTLPLESPHVHLSIVGCQSPTLRTSMYTCFSILPDLQSEESEFKLSDHFFFDGA